MSLDQPTQLAAVLVMIDIARLRHDVSIEAPGWKSLMPALIARLSMEDFVQRLRSEPNDDNGRSIAIARLFQATVLSRFDDRETQHIAQKVQSWKSYGFEMSKSSIRTVGRIAIRKLLVHLGLSAVIVGLCRPVPAQATAGAVAPTPKIMCGVEYGTIADPLLRQIIPVPQMRNGVIDAGWWSRHERDLADLAASGPVHLLFVGDSITDNYRKSGPAPNQVFKPTWDQLFAPHGALNLGVSGDSTQHVLWRLEHGEVDGLAPDDIVLMIGTNNTWHDSRASAEAVAEGIKAVVYTLHAKMPCAAILVLGILPSAVSVEKSTKDTAINRLVAAALAQSKFAHTLDLSSLFLQSDGELNASLFYDPTLSNRGKAVHPNTIGQRKMAEAVMNALYGGTQAMNKERSAVTRNGQVISVGQNDQRARHHVQ